MRRIGMAVDCGLESKKEELSQLLEMAAQRSFEIGLWIEGSPFDVTLRAIVAQLQEQSKCA